MSKDLTELFRLKLAADEALAKGEPKLTLKVSSNKPQIKSADTKITVLRSLGLKMCKSFSIDSSGDLEVSQYDNAANFYWQRLPVSDITSLSAHLTDLSKWNNAVLIRGDPVGTPPQPAQRKKEIFNEPGEGCWWVMLDLDDIQLPEGLSPIDPAAIEFLIQKLPPEFHGVSYFYQFSASAGIMMSNGEPRKSGINVHLVFWLDRPIPGKDIAAWLKLYCIETGFYEEAFDRAGEPRIVFGVDDSVLKNPVQPHYVALPVIGPNVTCRLAPEHRQGLVKKEHQAVGVPLLEAGLQEIAKAGGQNLLDTWKRKNGWVSRTNLSRTKNGAVTVERYFRNSDETGLRLGRTLIRAQIEERNDSSGEPIAFARLYFEEENSPGSWWTCDRSPTIATKFGSGERISLKELSASAYDYVRDELKWFKGISHRELALGTGGFLPPFSKFITAQNTLLLAPTGSGKTTAVANYAQFNARSKIILYAAQTIALTHQMAGDLQQRGVIVHHYQTFSGGYRDMEPGFYITTNASLKRFVRHLEMQGASYVLLIDEAHLAIDEFMRTDDSNELLEKAITRSEQAIFMTGTLTQLQISKISMTVEVARGRLDAQTFEFCEFFPVKSNPLLWANEGRFGADCVAMFRTYQALKVANQPIPRTVLLVPTSDMTAWKLMLEKFGLLEDAKVVSRSDSSADEIEDARQSGKSILISSPLFAIGINFVNAPVRLWTAFGRLEVDESQIIQTVNRANRTELPCEVRLYAGRLDGRPFPSRSAEEERDEIEAFLLGESETPGIVHPRWQLDRVTYLRLRDTQEKDTARSLYRLKEDNAIQNYEIINDWTSDFEEVSDDGEIFKALTSGAKEQNRDVISQLYQVYTGGNLDELLFHHELNRERSRDYKDKSLVPKDFEYKSKAILAAVTGNRAFARPVDVLHAPTVLRLHGKLLPFLSGQYAEAKTTAWKPALAEKIRAILLISKYLKQLREGEINGTDFGKKLRLKEVRQGALALSRQELDFDKWQRRLVQLDELHEIYAGAGKDSRKNLDDKFFRVAVEFLKPIGITFEKTAGSAKDRRQRLNPAKPVVPPDWNFEHMMVSLEILAESVEHRSVRSPDCKAAERNWTGPGVSAALCQGCAHCTLDWDCQLGIPIYSWGDDTERAPAQCAEFKPLSKRVLGLRQAMIRAANQHLSGLKGPRSAQEIQK